MAVSQFRAGARPAQTAPAARIVSCEHVNRADKSTPEKLAPREQHAPGGMPTHRKAMLERFRETLRAQIDRRNYRSLVRWFRRTMPLAGMLDLSGRQIRAGWRQDRADILATAIAANQLGDEVDRKGTVFTAQPASDFEEV